MEETRKPIEWYEWLYEISDIWNIKSFYNKYNRWRIILKKTIVKWYEKIWLYNNKWKLKTYSVHRLVANAFIINPNNKITVNHKDWNKQNNCANNLEWNTISENTLHWFRQLWRKHPALWKFWKYNPKSKKVYQYTKDWILIKIRNCWKEIQNELWYKTNGIYNCCLWTKYYKTAYGFIWKYDTWGKNE